MPRGSETDEYTAYVTARAPALRRSAYLLCGDWHRADDLVQVTITKLYVHWRRASRADNLDAYTRQILLRSWLDERRLGWFRRVRAAGSAADIPDRPALTSDPDQRLALRQALSQLPPRQRATVVLRFWEDLSVAETARLLRCSEGTVKSQTAQALTALRRLLAEPTFGPPAR
ncbi:MAG: SigE family RNA polymerase sigma factor [Mycobacteriales bacterium]